MGHDMSADMRAGALHALARGLRDKGRMLVALTLSAGIERLSGELVSALGTHACLRVLNLEGNALRVACSVFCCCVLCCFTFYLICFF